MRSPCRDSSRPASAAAGTRSGASFTASKAPASDAASSASARASASAASSTARWRSRGRLVEEAERGAPLDEGEGAAPIAFGGARLEHRVVGPGDGRRLPRRFRRVVARRLGVAAPARLDEQAAQAEDARLVAVEHAPEGRLGGVAVARDLRRLRLEQQGQRLAPQQALGFARVAPRRHGIAGADGDHAARHGRIAARPAARARGEAHAARQAQEEPDDRPQQGQQHRQRDRHDRRGGDGRLDAVAAPGDEDPAGPVGEPDRSESSHAQEADEDESAPHDTNSSF